MENGSLSVALIIDSSATLFRHVNALARGGFLIFNSLPWLTHTHTHKEKALNSRLWSYLTPYYRFDLDRATMQGEICPRFLESDEKLARAGLLTPSRRAGIVIYDYREVCSKNKLDRVRKRTVCNYGFFFEEWAGMQVLFFTNLSTLK